MKGPFLNLSLLATIDAADAVEDWAESLPDALPTPFDWQQLSLSMVTQNPAPREVALARIDALEIAA